MSDDLDSYPVLCGAEAWDRASRLAPGEDCRGYGLREAPHPGDMRPAYWYRAAEHGGSWDVIRGVRPGNCGGES